MLESDSRLGFYLIPPAKLSAEVLQLRHLVQDQYRVGAALNFMIHMTIKGFFKPASAELYPELIHALDTFMSGYKPFTLYPTGIKRFPDDGIGIECAQAKNPVLWEIHTRCFDDIIKPFIADDCEFTPVEPTGERFVPHITISMRDLSPQISEDIHNYLSGIDFSPEGYVVNNFKLYEFTSEGWGTDEWIYSLDWNILHSWFLK